MQIYKTLQNADLIYCMIDEENEQLCKEQRESESHYLMPPYYVASIQSIGGITN